jgi:hypothetical protein
MQRGEQRTIAAANIKDGCWRRTGPKPRYSQGIALRTRDIGGCGGCCTK